MAARFTAGEGGGATWLALGGRVPLVVPLAVVVDVVLPVGAVVVLVLVLVLVGVVVVVVLAVVGLLVVELLVVELPAVALATAGDESSQAAAMRASAIPAPRRTRRPRPATCPGWPFLDPCGIRSGQKLVEWAETASG
jgi:hypothetical protein